MTKRLTLALLYKYLVLIVWVIPVCMYMNGVHRGQRHRIYWIWSYNLTMS